MKPEKLKILNIWPFKEKICKLGPLFIPLLWQPALPRCKLPASGLCTEHPLLSAAPASQIPTCAAWRCKVLTLLTMGNGSWWVNIPLAPAPSLGKFSLVCHILYTSSKGSGRIKLWLLKVVTSSTRWLFLSLFLSLQFLTLAPWQPLSQAMLLKRGTQTKTLGTRSAPRKLTLRLGLWNWTSAYLLCEMRNHWNILSRGVTWPNQYF